MPLTVQPRAVEADDHSFGDIHYFYSPETERPRHHRFDKGSYVYLFENANERRARVEIANHPGSDDQDAFDGCKCASSRDCQTGPH